MSILLGIIFFIAIVYVLHKNTYADNRGTATVSSVNFQPSAEQLIEQRLLIQWKTFKRETNDDNLRFALEDFILKFFVRDRISVSIFRANLAFVQEYSRFDYCERSPDYGKYSDLLYNIPYLPPLFEWTFVAAYPDVYIWCQKNAERGSVIGWNKLADMSETDVKSYILIRSNKLSFYRSLVDQFKAENKILDSHI